LYLVASCSFFVASEAIAERGELADLKLTPHVDLPLNWTTQKRMVGLE